MTEWKTINTVLKNGEVVDLWHFEFGRHADMYWGKPLHCCGEDGRHCDSEWHKESDGWVCGMTNEFSFAEEEFTHWMPTPCSPFEKNKTYCCDDYLKLESAVLWCLDRDKRNGSLPEAYAEKLMEAVGNTLNSPDNAG